MIECLYFELDKRAAENSSDELTWIMLSMIAQLINYKFSGEDIFSGYFDSDNSNDFHEYPDFHRMEDSICKSSYDLPIITHN